MALIYMDGFDEGLIAYRGWQRSTASAAGRFGGLALNTGNYPSGASQYFFPTPPTGTVVVGAAVMTLTRGTPFLGFGPATLGTNGSGALTLSNGGTLVATSAAVYWPTNVWRYVELKYVTTTGACTVRIDGNVVVSGTVATAANVALMNFAPGQDPCYVDDLYVLDSTGTTNKDFLGDVRVQTLYPASDGTNSQMTPSTGTTHFSLVNETVPNTTNYVSSSTVGQKDTYHLQSLNANTASVFAVEITNYSSKDAAGPAGFSNVVHIGSTDYASPSQSLSASWASNQDVLETNPATSVAWTPTDINGAEFGVQVT